MSERANLYAVTTTDFESRVLEASHATLVLVDFWAAWCGPCRSLAPVLEQLADRHQDTLAIAKIDSDAEPALAARYGVRSLPTLLLFKQGEIVEQTAGAQPLNALEALVARHAIRASDRMLETALAAQAAGDHETARNLLAEAARIDPDNHRLAPLHAALLLDAGELDAAAAVIEAVPTRAANDALAHQAARLRFARLAQDCPPRADLEIAVQSPGHDSATAFQVAVTRLRDGEYDAGLDVLLGIVARDRAWGDDAARKLILDVFALLPAGDPRVREYRARLSRALN
jgi:putative thioredoxin